MARYSDTVRNQNEEPVAGVDVYVALQGGGSPILTDDDGNTLTQPLITDEYGAFYFNADEDFYDIDYYYGSRLVTREEGVPVGNPYTRYIGPTGPADNTYFTLSTFKAQAVTNGSARLVNAPGIANGDFSWTPGNYTGQADDINIIESDNEPLSEGAWQRQGSASIYIGDGKSLEDFLTEQGIVCYPNDSEEVLRAKIAAANDGGYTLLFAPGTYQIANVTTTLAFFTVRALGGVVIIQKNDDGPLWTHSGDYALFQGIHFAGQNEFDESGPTSTWTGHNLVITGYGARFLDCGSNYAAGRALLATKTVQVIGSNPNWQTSATGSSAFDIENGIDTDDPADVCLYSQFVDVVSNSSSGGLKFLNCGSQVVSGGQIGKYVVTATDPSAQLAGTNGGHLIGARVTNDVQIDVSSAILIGNQCGTDTITFGAHTSNCVMDATNGYKSTTVINNLGNASNLIARNTGTEDGIGGIRLRYGASGTGADGAGAYWDIVPSKDGSDNPDPTNAIHGTDGSVFVGYNRGLKSRLSGSSSYGTIAVMYQASGSTSFGYISGSGSTLIGSGTGGVYQYVGTVITQATASTFVPGADNTISLGSGGARWSEVFAANGTINTSDERKKDWLGPLTEAHLRAARRIAAEIGLYQWKASVAEKGEDRARIHVGVRAQAVWRIMIEEGLELPMGDRPDVRHSFLTYDEWKDQFHPVVGEDGEPTGEVVKAVEAGNIWGVRPDELNLFLIAAQEARLAALEAA